MAKKQLQPKSSSNKLTASDIVAMVDEKRSSAEFTALFDQFDADFGLFTLDPAENFTPEKDHQSYISPAPRNDFLKVFHSVNKASLTWQIAIAEDAPEKEREAATELENLITGIFDTVDRGRRKIGEPVLRAGLAWYGCGRGMAAVQCLIYADDNKETKIDIRSIDPMCMAWEQGADGLVWAASTYQISKAELLDRWGKEISGDEATIIDFFNRHINAIVFKEGGDQQGGQFIKNEPHNLDHVPMFLGFASGMPSVFRRNNQETLRYRASSVYASSRNIYKPRNKQISFVMDKAEQSVAGTLTYETETGKKMIKGDPFGAWQIIPLVKGEVLKELVPPQVPAASGIVLSILDRDKQESTVPFPIGYGLDPQAHSGAALAMMQDNTRSIYGPYTSLIADCYQWLCEEIPAQFKQKGQKLTLRGYNKAGKFFTLEANPSEIRDDWYINVKCEPVLPRDEEAAMRMALLATQIRQDGRPYLSTLTAYEDISKLQDPLAEKRRIDDEQIEALINRIPSIHIRRLAKKLQAEGDKEGAEELLASIPAPGGGGQPATEGMAGRVPQGAPGAGGAMSQGAPGMGSPQGIPPGMPMPTPQELQQLMAIAEQLLREGKPIPPELAQVLQQAAAQGGGQPPVV